MGNRLIKIMLVALLICSASCTSLKRYKSLKISGIDSTLADINLFGTRLSQPEPGYSVKSLWDLSADAQSQFIKILNNRYPDNGKFLSSLSNEYMRGEEEFITDNYVRKDLRLVFSVSKKRDYIKSDAFHQSGLSAADRLEYLKISVIIKDTCLKFRGWNMYATEYGAIDIGDVSFTRSLDLTASASVTGKKNGPDLSAETGTSVSRKEDQQVKYRYIMLNGRLSDLGIEMEEEGTREIDLTGNIIAEVSVEFESTGEMVTKIKGLKDSSGVFNLPDNLSLNTFVVDVPDIAKIKDGIEADLKMDFVYRNVKRGRKTFPEWDDRVKYYKGHKESIISLFKDSEYVPGFCCIGTGQGGNRKEFVNLDRGNETAYPMIFSTYEEASAFSIWLMDWLRKNEGKSVKIGGQLLKFKSKDLTYEQIKGDPGFGIVTYYW